MGLAAVIEHVAARLAAARRAGGGKLLIKLDIEGGESAVLDTLLGPRWALCRADAFLVEWHPTSALQNSQNYRALRHEGDERERSAGRGGVVDAGG